MARVRTLERDDVPELTRLHRRAFANAKDPGRLESYLARVFFDHPWRDAALPSLAYEDDAGRLIGCVGIMPRPMLLDGRRIRCVVTHTLMVDPDRRHPMAALRLARASLSGPQDVSLADGNHRSKAIWRHMGGASLPYRSLRWIRLLRPAGLAVHLFRKRTWWPLAAIARPISRWVDAAAVRVAGGRLRPDPPGDASRPLTAETLAGLIRRFARGYRLQPVYDDEALDWLLRTLAETREDQLLRAIAVTDAAGDPLGWYVYCARPGAMGHVLQLAAQPDGRDRVLQHLIYDAWEHETVALAGQVDPRWLEAYAHAGCVFDSAGFSMLVHARRSEAMTALCADDAFLTRLEGESWLRFAL